VNARGGFLLAVCGIDGSGKSTLARGIVERLRAKGGEAVLLRPLAGDPEFVRGVRTAMEAAGSTGWRTREGDVDFLAAYFGYALAANVHERVVPLLDAGAVVVCDRYLWSHLANQRAFGHDLEEFAPLFATLPAPDLTLWMEVPPAVAIERVARRATRGVGDNLPFIRRAHREFERLAEEHGFVRLDATRPKETVLAECLAVLAERRARVAVVG
jgi:dTMP kinase